MEALPGHKDMSYYHRWAAGMIAVSLERKTFSLENLEDVLGAQPQSVTSPGFSPGQEVRVKFEDAKVRWSKPHIRTPGYLFGAVGVIDRFLDCFPNPERLAFFPDKAALLQPLYLVRFKQKDLWSSAHHDDDITAEVYEPWLEDVAEKVQEVKDENVVIDAVVNTEVVDHGDHVHDTRYDTETESVRREMLTEDSPGKKMAETLIQVLRSQKVLDTESLMSVVEMLDSRGQMMFGQHLVAAAWTDPAYKARLLEDGNLAAAELGIVASNANAPTKFVVVENTCEVHHVVVCTLCSCYPSGVMGMAPAWYKSRSYRARTIREPRKVLLEFGLDIPPDQKIVVHDSTADCRYMVLPARPAWTRGWSRDQLVEVINRDSLIGVSIPKQN